MTRILSLQPDELGNDVKKLSDTLETFVKLERLCRGEPETITQSSLDIDVSGKTEHTETHAHVIMDLKGIMALPLSVVNIPT